jgi:hypothetical protein
MHPDQWPDFGIDPSEAPDRFAALGLQVRPIPSTGPLFTQGGHVVLESLT